jgi:hypothetical protein
MAADVVVFVIDVIAKGIGWLVEQFNKFKATKFGEAVLDMFEKIRKSGPTGIWFIDMTIKVVTGAIENFNKLKTALKSILNTIKTYFIEFKNSKLGQIFLAAFSGIGKVASLFAHPMATIVSALNKVIDLINRGLVPVIKVLRAIASKLPGGGGILKQLADGLKPIPYLSTGWTPPSEAGQSGRTGNLLQYASGGLPTKGSIFIAGESGPELIGSFGNNPSTVVPLKDTDFVNAIAKAVYNAMTTAMAQQGSSEVVLQVDSVKLAKAVAKGSRLGGYSGGSLGVIS